MTTDADRVAEMIIIRGLPGSGKTTLAKAMRGHKHFEADLFFERSGKYEFDPSQVNEAHIWCAGKVMESLLHGENVVVSNTFSRLFEMEKYLEAAAHTGCSVRLIEATGNWQNKHGIPEAVIDRMRNRWEEITEIDIVRYINKLQRRQSA